MELNTGFNLDAIQVATPCPADWNAMTGDEQARFCGQCQLNVYNLSGMTRSEAEALVRDKEGRLCIRFFRRADGTVITKDCPVGLKMLHEYKTRNRIRKIKTAAAVISLITVVGAFTTIASAEGETVKGRVKTNYSEIKGDVAGPQEIRGEAVAPQPKQTMGKPANGTLGQPVQGSPPPRNMGIVAPPPPKPDPNTTEPPCDKKKKKK